MIKIVKAIVKLYFKIVYKVRLEGEENLPETGGAVVIANHSTLKDPVILFCFLKRPVAFMAKEELFENKILAFILKKANAFPVNREKSDLKAVKTAIRTLKKGGLVGIFPQGTRVKEADAAQAKEGAVFIAQRSCVPVIPVAIKSDFKFRSELTVKIFEKVDVEPCEEKNMKALSENIFSGIADYISK